MTKIKHNDLTHYFLRPHQELPRAYLASCEKFFKSIKQRGLTKKEERLGWITRGYEPASKIKVDKQGSGGSIGIYKKEYVNKRSG